MLTFAARLQSAGFTVVAEKLNFFRYLSHFRSVHRGAYFMQLRTTAVRKLLPESFGFMCPVHTPDGSPCGLLNHLTHRCNVVAEDASAASTQYLVQVLISNGVTAARADSPPPRLPAHIAVHVDGRTAGYVEAARAPALVAKLRAAKAEAWLQAQRAGGLPAAGPVQVPYHMEARVTSRCKLAMRAYC